MGQRIAVEERGVSFGPAVCGIAEFANNSDAIEWCLNSGEFGYGFGFRIVAVVRQGFRSRYEVASARDKRRGRCGVFRR